MSTEIRNVSDQLKQLRGHLPRVLAELESVNDKPRIVIILANAFIEDLVNTLCRKHLVHFKEFQRLSSAEKLYVLVEVGHISPTRARTIDWIRSKRNKIAHSALFELDDSHMPEWADPDHKTADKAFSLCVHVIAGFWNEHVDAFREVYLEV